MKVERVTRQFRYHRLSGNRIYNIVIAEPNKANSFTAIKEGDQGKQRRLIQVRERDIRQERERKQQESSDSPEQNS